MIIGVCGYGYTGSGAMLDLLREYKDFSQLKDDVELIFSYYPDGLESLAYHLYEAPSRYMSPDIAMHRFETFMNQYNASGAALNRCTNGKLPILTRDFLNHIASVS